MVHPCAEPRRWRILCENGLEGLGYEVLEERPTTNSPWPSKKEDE